MVTAIVTTGVSERIWAGSFGAFGRQAVAVAARTMNLNSAEGLTTDEH